MNRIGSRRKRAPRGSGDLLRTEILTATRTLLAGAHNADEVSIRAVADLVGVSAPSIYRHFADKDALLDAVVAEVFADLDAEMERATADADSPMERLRGQGLAYVRFARHHPEQYRLATMQATESAGDIDRVLGTSAFTHFVNSIEACIADGVLAADADPIRVALDLWAAAHGIASLLIAKPYLPWGDPEEAAERVLRAACMGHSVNGLLDDPTPAQFRTWLGEQRQ